MLAPITTDSGAYKIMYVFVFQCQGLAISQAHRFQKADGLTDNFSGCAFAG
ncbi:hypothetical protein GAMM_290006 [Gammaproteobacteria bacterium]